MEQLLAGRLDAVLTYWTSVARLEARGMRALLPMAEVLRGLGFPEPLPMVGWTFSDAWAAATGRAPRERGTGRGRPARETGDTWPVPHETRFRGARHRGETGSPYTDPGQPDRPRPDRP